MRSKDQQFISANGLNAYKALAYHYATHFEHSCILDSCQLNTGVYNGKYEFIAAYGADNVYRDYNLFLDHLAQANEWLFGILSYDLKNKIENLQSNNTPIIETPELLFFNPKIVLAISKNGNVEMLKGELGLDFWDSQIPTNDQTTGSINSSINKSEYLEKIAQIQELIRAGEVYELNYCVPYHCSYSSFSPIHFHQQLIKKSPVPMASYLKAQNIHLCGASMERYLMKMDNQLISQPIKGTIRKGATSQEDKRLVEELYRSEKDRAENVMIVDLVRNDLNKICKTGTVQVDELFGIYSYLQVHQMISTISGTIKENQNTRDILEATFPMGSMTGAPKIAAMQHIENLENFNRGWFSGATGYISPDGHFDFNVVIRSLLCDTKKKILNFNAGGAITIDSDPELEWKEVGLKTKAIKELLLST